MKALALLLLGGSALAQTPAPAALPASAPASSPSAAKAPIPAPAAASAPAPGGAASVPEASPASAAQTIPKVEINGVAEQDDDSLRRRANAATSIYGREELDRQGDIDVTDVLKRLPGVSMDGGAPRMRGLGGGYTQVLINGEPAPPGFTLDSVAPADVERIEVIKGATAEFPAVAGTINIVLREPPRSRQLEWRGGLNYRAVQPGANTALQWGDRIGGVSFVLPLSLTRAAQGSAYDSERRSRNVLGEVQAQAIHGEDESRSSTVQLAPRLQWKFSPSDTLNMGGFVQRQDSDSRNARRIATLLGTPWTTAADGSQTDTQAQVTRFNASWQRRLDEGGKLELKGSWQDTQRDSEGHYESRRQDGSTLVARDSRTEFDETRSALGARWNVPLDDEHTLVTGWDLDVRERDELRRVWENGQERLDSATGIPFEARIQRQALFIQDEWSLSPQLSVLPGLRLEEVRTRSADSAGPIANVARVNTPLVHLNYRFDPKGRDQIRASLSRSFKMPDLGALSARYIVNGNYERDTTNTPIAADRAGNPALQPELSTGLDLAFEHYPASGGVLSVGVFYRRIDDLIRQRISLEDQPAPGVVDAPRWVSRPVNMGRAISRGLELELKGRAEDWLPVIFNKDSGVQIRAAWNLYRSKVEQVEGPDNRLEAQPPWLANLGFDARVAGTGWSWGASLILQPGYETQQTDRQITHRSANRALDAFALWRMDRRTQLRVAVANLLAPDNESASRVVDLDGFSAGSSTRRDTLRSVNVSWVMRF